VTDTSLDLTQEGPDDPGVQSDWDSLEEVPVEEVRELFVTLAKALRAYQLYDDNNPVYKRFVSALREAFDSLWHDMDHLTVRVTEDKLVLDTVEVYRNESRAESLAFLFFKDGIREVTFLPGIESAELTALLSVLQAARNVRPEGDDILTILWEEDLEHFRYNFVDVLAEGIALPEGGEGADPAQLQTVLEEEAEQAEEVEEARPDEAGAGDEGPQSFSRDDFNPTLYSLSAKEMQELQDELTREMTRDLRHDVLTALFDRLEEPEHPERQSEILDILHQLLPNFLSRGALGPASNVIEHLSELQEGGEVFDEERSAKVDELVDELSSTEVLEELVRALEDGTIRAEEDALGAFLSHLHAESLAPLLRAVERTAVRELQGPLRRAVRGIADRYPERLVALFDHRDPIVVAGAARLAGSMGVGQAAPELAELMGDPAPGIRLAAVEAAGELRASTAANSLIALLFDDIRDIRVAAAKVLTDLAYGPAAGHLEDLVTSKEIRDADLSEKIAIFEAFGAAARDEAVPVLDRMLNGKGFLGRTEPSEIRACAALALGRIDSDFAEASLRKARADDDAVVRSAVSRALRGERGTA